MDFEPTSETVPRDPVSEDSAPCVAPSHLVSALVDVTIDRRRGDDMSLF